LKQTNKQKTNKQHYIFEILLQIYFIAVLQIFGNKV